MSVVTQWEPTQEVMSQVPTKNYPQLICEHLGTASHPSSFPQKIQ